MEDEIALLLLLAMDGNDGNAMANIKKAAANGGEVPSLY